MEILRYIGLVVYMRCCTLSLNHSHRCVDLLYTMVRVNGQMDRRTDMTKRIVAFRNLEKAPKSLSLQSQ